MANTANTTAVKAMVHSLEIADNCNTNDVEAPCAVLWTDQDSQWKALVPLLRKLLPQLLTHGEYQLEQRTGPAIWLHCVVDNALPVLPAEATPILYLPGVGRQDITRKEWTRLLLRSIGLEPGSLSERAQHAGVGAQATL